MTTIAYKDGFIALDSRICNNNFITEDNYKKFDIVGAIAFFFTGPLYSNDLLINFYIHSQKVHQIYTQALVVQDGKVYHLMTYGKNLIKDDVINNFAIGTGNQFAIASMDHGKSAYESVIYASSRDFHTGGIIREFDINTFSFTKG